MYCIDHCLQLFVLGGKCCTLHQGIVGDMLYDVNMSRYAQKSLTDVSAAVLHNRLACRCCCISGLLATLKK